MVNWITIPATSRLVKHTLVFHDPSASCRNDAWLKRWIEDVLLKSKLQSPLLADRNIRAPGSRVVQIFSAMMSIFSPSARRFIEDSAFEIRNVDVILGLAYYAYATDILGNCNERKNLTYIEANLLASLYAGQLARAVESWSWIYTICRACQYLVREWVLVRCIYIASLWAEMVFQDNFDKREWRTCRSD